MGNVDWLLNSCEKVPIRKRIGAFFAFDADGTYDHASYENNLTKRIVKAKRRILAEALNFILLLSATDGDETLPRHVSALSLTALLLLSACGGGSGSGGSSAVPVAPAAVGLTAATSPNPTPAVSPASGSVLTKSSSFAVVSGSQTVVLPSLPQISGNALLNVSNPGAGNTLTITSNAAATFGKSLSISTQSIATTQPNTTSIPIYSLMVTIIAPLALQGWPEFTLTSPAFAGVAAADLTYQVFSDANCTNLIATSATASSVVGETATFNALTSPVELDPQHTYVFVFYLIEPVTSPTPQPTPETNVLKMWTLNAASNELLGTDITDPSKPVLTNTVSGSNTFLENPQGVEINADKNIVVVTNDGQDEGNYFASYGQYLTFTANATGNATPISVKSTGDFSAFGLRASDDGSHAVISSGVGEGEGGSDTIYNYPALTPESFSIDSDRTHINATAISDDNVLAVASNFNYAPGGVGEDFSVLTIGANSWYTGFVSNINAFGSPPPNYTLLPSLSSPQPSYSRLAFDPVSGNLFAMRGNNLVDIYPRIGFVLGQPLGTLTLPSYIANASDLGFTKDGRLYILAQDTSGNSVILRYASGVTAASAPDSLGDLTKALGMQVNGFIGLQQL